MKLNLGCGYTKKEGYINVDFDPLVKPDLIVDIGKPNWNIEANSVSAIQAHHVVEHLGDPDFFVFMKEMYRVCEPSAFIEIVVPHHRHDVFLNDPTHKRPITVEGIRLFSKKFNDHCIKVGDGSSKLGHYFDVDFEIIDFKMAFDDMYKPLLVDMTPEKEREIQMMIRERNNVIVDVTIKMIAVK